MVPKPRLSFVIFNENKFKFPAFFFFRPSANPKDCETVGVSCFPGPKVRELHQQPRNFKWWTQFKAQQKLQERNQVPYQERSTKKHQEESKEAQGS